MQLAVVCKELFGQQEEGGSLMVCFYCETAIINLLGQQITNYHILGQQM